MVLAFSLGDSMSKRHNHRQRKKLHLAEYRELGFNLEVLLHPDVTEAQASMLIDQFIEQVVEPRALIYGGTLGFGFLCTAVRGNATEEDQARVNAWWQGRPEVASAAVGQLSDAWH